MGKSSPSPPPAPDYAGAAREQGAANVETARLQGRINNPNISGPLGGQTVTFGENDQPTVTQTLTPQAQATLEAQQRVQRSLAGLGEQGIGTAQNVLRNAFNPNLAGLQTNVGNAGQIPQTPDLSRYGQASGLQGQRVGDGRGNRPLTVEETTSMNNPDVFRGKNAPPPSHGNLGGDVEMPQPHKPDLGGDVEMPQPHKTDLGGPGRELYTPTNNQGNIGQAPSAPELSAYGMAGANVNAQPVNAGPQAGQYGMAGAGPQAGQYGYAGGGPGGGQYGMAGANVQAGAINQGPQTGQYGLASGALNTSNVAAMPVNAGMTGQQAIMNRLAPQLERSDAATRQRLINQGLVPGGEAYENAMISQNQQKNDLLSQAALQGIGLDTAANAQGFGQALQAGQYGNQAVAQNFSQAQAAQAAQNAAQQQGFAQQFGLAGLQNQAVGQNFGQGVTAQQLQNAGIGQNFAQGQAANAAGNQAVGQNFGQGLAAQQAQNAASQQLYNQYMGVQGLQNQAVNQNQQAALAQYQAQLGGQQQGFGQNVTQRQLGNQAIAQNQQAALQQQQAALAAQNQQYNQLLQGAQFGNTAQQQSLQQQLALRNQPLNEIAGLMSGSQIQMPQFQGYQGANVAGTPIFAGAQAAGQAAMDQYGIQSANVNAQNAGLYGMLGTAGGLAGMAAFSDRRLKSNIERIGTHPLGIGVYEYNIFDRRERGVMADEVETVMPEAVVLHPSGYKMVDYGMLT